MTNKRLLASLPCLLTTGALLWGCATEAPKADLDPEETAGESWSITAWGQHFEIFPEAQALVAGETTAAHVHVTRLADSSPLAEGSVELVLASPSSEQVFVANEPDRPGVYTISVTPEAAAELDLSFRIRTPESEEVIRGGRVRVGTAQHPGRLLVAPAPKSGSGGEPQSFLKEEQWRSALATSWVRRGELARSLEGQARIRPPAGGDAVLSSAIDGVVHGAGGWPFVGQGARRGESLFRIAPRVAAERSLAALEAEAAGLEIEKRTVVDRLSRLQELLTLEAVSQRQVLDQRSRAEILEARHQAALRDLEAARAARQGGLAGSLAVKAPFAGQMAQVMVGPGATVAAGDPLARWVRTDSIWIEVQVAPGDQGSLTTDGVTGVVLTQGRRQPLVLRQGVRLVSVAPEVSPVTGTIAVLLEAPAPAGLALGTSLQARILLSQSRAGIVIPSSALIDDGGVPVVYLQLAGESFLRQEVRVVERQGDRLLVAGLEPGQRLVHRGGDSIRRSSLMSSGGAHGHVH